MKPIAAPLKSGDRFWRWTLIDKTNHKRAHWLCVCECGNKRIVQQGHFLNGRSKSCGCYFRDFFSEKARLNNAKNPNQEILLRVLRGMKQRCYNESCKSYKDYGGRGITICERWLSNPLLFVSDMGDRPVGGTIERKNNDGNYEPTNCRWATRKEQNNNKRNNRRITIAGQTLSRAAWAEKSGVNYATVSTRIRTLRWSEEKALGQKSSGGGKLYEYKGEKKTMLGWALYFGFTKEEIKGRIKIGWTFQEAVETPRKPQKNPYRNKAISIAEASS